MFDLSKVDPGTIRRWISEAGGDRDLVQALELLEMAQRESDLDLWADAVMELSSLLVLERGL